MTRLSINIWKNPIYFAAFGFGSGTVPKAPGTFGTLAALVLYLFLSQLSLVVYLAVIILAFALGVFICDRTSRDLGVHDHGGIVWDEFVGYWVTMVAAPPGWLWIVLGFIFFRFFDIVKPWPIKWLDNKVKGGFGIMIDDIVAGIMAFICLQLIHGYLP